MAGNSRKVPDDIHGDFSCRFMSRVSHLPERWIAVIVRHRIVKPRLDDELAALEDARHRFLVFNKSGEVQTPKVIVTAATIESRRLDDFIFGLLEVEQPENLERIQDNPKQRKVQENLGFPWLWHLHANQWRNVNALPLSQIQRDSPWHR